MSSYFRFVLHHRLLVLAACLVITGLAGFVASRATIGTNLPEMILGSDPAFTRYVELTERFGSDQQLLVAFPARALTEIDPAAQLRRIVGALETLEGVAGVTGPLDPRPGHPQGEPTLDLERLGVDPLIGGLLVSADGAHLALIIEPVPAAIEMLERAPVLVTEVLDVLVSAGIDRSNLRLGGLVATLAEVERQSRIQGMVLTPIVAGLLLLTTWLLFRRLSPVVITMVIGAVAIVWTLGFAVAVFGQLNLMLVLAPALILIISFSDVVHLCSAYMTELSAGRERDDAILACAADVGRACLYTSMTTFVGFVSLTLIDVPAFRQLGLVLGFGVAIALLLAMTLAPVMFTLMPPPRPWGERGVQHLLDRGLSGLRLLATRRPWTVIAAFALVAALAAVGTSRITLETDLAARMPEGNPLRQGIAYLDRHFSGSTVLEVFVEFPPESRLRRLGQRGELMAFEAAIVSRPDVGRVLSILDVVRALLELDAGVDLRPALSDGSRAARYAAAVEGGFPPGTERLLDPDSGMARFVVFVRDTRAHGVYEIGEAIRALGATHLGSGVDVEPTGFMYLAGRWLQRNLISQRWALLFSFGMIAIMMAVIVRSLWVGFVSMVPNLIPLLAVGGVLGAFMPVVDSDTIIVALIAIGIAVDDTIHFLTRARTEMRGGRSPEEAMERTFGYAGRAIVMTSVIFAVGFAPFALSDYLPFRLIGLLLPFAMIVALVADVLLLPALITAGLIRLRP